MRRPRPRRHRIDGNQAEIVSTLRRVGALVLPLSDLGGDVADLLVSYHGRLFLLEAKDGTNSPTSGQVRWLAAWGGKIVRSPDDALRAVGAVR